MGPSDRELPDYESPPVTEIVAALQFRPRSHLDMAAAVALARALDDWRVVDVQAAIPPMSEAPAGQPQRQELTLGFGDPPMRLLLATEDQRWLSQVQHDRVALHERGSEERPSYKHVAPKFREFATQAGDALDQDPFGAAEFAELTYVNSIARRRDDAAGELRVSDVLRVIRSEAGDEPFSEVEQISAGFSYLLEQQGAMQGRLRVHLDHQVDEEGKAILVLRLVSRRFVREAAPEGVLDQCHADIVEGFTAITTDEMHSQWRRIR